MKFALVAVVVVVVVAVDAAAAAAALVLVFAFVVEAVVAAVLLLVLFLLLLLSVLVNYIFCSCLKNSGATEMMRQPRSECFWKVIHPPAKKERNIISFASFSHIN